MKPAPLPRWLVIWLAVLGLAAGTAVAVLTYSVIDLHARVISVDTRMCAAERADRGIDAAIAAAGRLPVTVPPLTTRECP